MVGKISRLQIDHFLLLFFLLPPPLFLRTNVLPAIQYSEGLKGKALDFGPRFFI